MKLRRTTIVLGSLLAISLVGNTWQFLSAIGHSVGDFYDSQYKDVEIVALRAFSYRLAAGDSPRVALQKAGAEPDGQGWVRAGPLRAKLDGERLVMLCGSAAFTRDTCAEDAK